MHLLFPRKSILKMYTLGVSLLIYLKDVYSGYFPAHLSENCIYWVFPYTSHLKMCILGIFTFTSTLMACLLGINMHIYLKDAYAEYFPTHQSERRIY